MVDIVNMVTLLLQVCHGTHCEVAIALMFHMPREFNHAIYFCGGILHASVMVMVVVVMQEDCRKWLNTMKQASLSMVVNLQL